MFGLVPVFYCTYFKIPSLEWSVKSRFPVLDCIGTPFACMDCIEAPWAYVQKPCDWNVWDTLCLVCFGTPSSWNFLGHLLLEMFWDTLCAYIDCVRTPFVLRIFSNTLYSWNILGHPVYPLPGARQ